MPRPPALSSVSAAALFAAFALPALAEQAPFPDWREAEKTSLTNHVQLTFPDRFLRAGEAYFDPEARWIIFQATPVPPEGQAPSPHYEMYVARLTRDEAGRVTGIDEPIQISKLGSANTCGFFHPKHPWSVIFGSTIEPPNERRPSGYQREGSRYEWQFPSSMEVCSRAVIQIFADYRPDQVAGTIWGENLSSPVPLWEREGYDAECAFSPDGRFIVFTAVDPETADPDLHIFDTTTKKSWPIVEAKGYDGGPFFSPDGKRLCYRSDRAGNDLLQVYVADLRFDESGAPVAVERERAITSDEHVNWAPYWHPSGRFVLVTTSREGHQNYEVYAIEVPAADAPDEGASALASRRITFAPGFDGMPVFSSDGRLMMWTSQRGGKLEHEQRPSSQVWIAEVVNAAP